MRFSLGSVGRAGVSIGSRWTSGPLITRFCVWCLPKDLCGSCFLERLAFSDEFGQLRRQCLSLCRGVLRVGGLVLLRQLFFHIPRASGVRTLCARASVILLRMDSWLALVCCGFGSIRRSDRVRFRLVLLSLVCVSQVYGMRVRLPVRAVCGLLWRIVLLWGSLPILSHL